MALPNKSIQQIKDLLGNNVDVAPTMMTDSSKTYKAELDTLYSDEKIEIKPFVGVLGQDYTVTNKTYGFSLNNISLALATATIQQKRDIQLELPYATDVNVMFNFHLKESANISGEVMLLYESLITDNDLNPQTFILWVAWNSGEGFERFNIYKNKIVSDVKINNTSILSGDGTLPLNEAGLYTEGTYNASNNKIATMSDIQYPVKDVYVDGSSVVDNTTKIAHITLPSGALKFLGTTTTALSDGSTTNPITINGQSVTATGGCVVLYDNKEYLWNDTISTPAWEEFGDENSFALKTTTITGTGVLGGGGALDANRTITHNELNTSGAKTTSGIYKLKIDKYGHITEATLDDKVVHTSNTSGLIKNDGTIDTTQYTTNTGTVTSVDLSMPTGFSVSGNPITASGTFNVALASGYDLLNSNSTQTIAGEKMFTSAITLYNSSNGDTPLLIFRRGELTDNYNDWAIVDSAGLLYLKQRGSGSTDWSDTRVIFAQAYTDIKGEIKENGTSLASKYVRCDTNTQGLTDTKKENARTNIGAGTYSKPSGGIPSSDLADTYVKDVQIGNTSVVNSSRIAQFEELTNAEIDEICSGAGSNPSGLQTMLLNYIYPVGSIYMSVNNVSPASFLGGNWERIQDKFLLAGGSTYTPGTTGGEATHTLTVDEMPSHNHDISDGTYNRAWYYGTQGSWDGGARWINNPDFHQADGRFLIANTGGGQAHNNMPPYLSVYVWKRLPD